MYVVMSVVPFKAALRLPGHEPVEVEIYTQAMAGYLPVYRTREEAEAEWPGHDVKELMPR